MYIYEHLEVFLHRFSSVRQSSERIERKNRMCTKYVRIILIFVVIF